MNNYLVVEDILFSSLFFFFVEKRTFFNRVRKKKKMQQEMDATLLKNVIDDVSNYKMVTFESKLWQLLYDYCQKNLKIAKLLACLSVMYENGFLVEKNVQLANELREDAAYSGHCMSAYQLANDEKNENKRYVWLRLASNEIVDAEYKLGKLYLSKYGGSGDKEAIKCFEKCGDQHAKALRRRGILLQGQKKYEEAYNLLVQASNLNDYDACSELFAFIALDVYKPSVINASHVFPCLMKAANAGHARSCAQIGYAYFIGRQIPSFTFGKNYELAAHWLERAESLGNARACYRLGTMHENGFHYPISNSKAFALFTKAITLFPTKASEQDFDGLATFKVGLLYSTGMRGALSDGKEDLIANREQGLQFLKIAADVHKNTDAMFECGKYYKQEKNTSEALRYWKIASKKGHANAKFALFNYYSKKQLKYKY